MSSKGFKLTKEQAHILEKEGWEIREKGFHIRLYPEDPDADQIWKIAGKEIEDDTESLAFLVVGVSAAKFDND